ncbi:hypothetical protein GCM10027418_00840 [Mariniluteicoccus endophyticus]
MDVKHSVTRLAPATAMASVAGPGRHGLRRPHEGAHGPRVPPRDWDAVVAYARPDTATWV